MEFLAIPFIIYFNAFLTGVITKCADLVNDDGLKASKVVNILLGMLWGILASLVVLGNADIAAFYLGILLSWIFRYKLDNYAHGIGGSILLVAIFFVYPISSIQLLIAGVTFVLFTFFGLLTRHQIISKNIFVDYNVYSFIFLVGLSIFYSNIWIVALASLANVVGYHGVKQGWKRFIKISASRRIEV